MFSPTYVENAQKIQQKQITFFECYSVQAAEKFAEGLEKYIKS